MLPPSVEHVTIVSCGVDHMRDEQVSSLTALTALAVLESKRSQPPKLRLPPDAAQLTQLRRLSLSTPEVPACLGSLPLLEYLVADQTAITPTGLKSLSQLTVLSGGRSTSWCSIYCVFRFIFGAASILKNVDRSWNPNLALSAAGRGMVVACPAPSWRCWACGGPTTHGPQQSVNG